MRGKFIYPTKKNTVLAFFLCQLLPVLVLGINGHFDDFLEWIKFEFVILGSLSLWQLKPIGELDEREKEITLKWKSRILDFGSALVLVPIVTLSFKPGIEGWSLYHLTAIPIFIIFIVCSIMTKKEFGYFFHQTN